MQFRIRMGYVLNLKNPKTFSEKIQWLKIYDRNPLYPQMVDKYFVKGYIANIIGKKHVIPTLGYWDNPDMIEWESLPKQFVLKSTFGGGSNGVIVCPNKDKLDKIQTIEKLKKSFKQDIYNDFREWPYRYIKKGIIAEQFMSQEDGSPLIDYKFYCFNGQPFFIYMSQNIPNHTRAISAFLNMDWELMPFKKKHDNYALNCPQKPVLFDILKNTAIQLAKDFPFVRVDLYQINNEVYFSELTFYPSSGMQPFEPREWDRKLGDMLVLPEKRS